MSTNNDVRSLAFLLGRDEDDAQLRLFLNDRGSDSRLEKKDDSFMAYICLSQHGMALMYVDEAWLLADESRAVPGRYRLETIHFVSAGKEPGLSEYDGPLIQDIAFGDTRDTVRGRLGMPTTSSDEETTTTAPSECPIVDRYDFGGFDITLEYEAPSHRLTLVSLTLFSDKKVVV